MPIEQKLLQQINTSNIKKEHKPTLVTWKGKGTLIGAEMVRNHSIMAIARQLVLATESTDVLKIGIIGNQDTGKSTFAICLAHLMHKFSTTPFSVRIFTKDDLIDFEKTVKSLDPANYIIIFDDVSFLSASHKKNQIEMVKQQLTEIRHMDGREGRKDVKIVIIMNYHYTLGLDKYLRQSEYTFFTSIGSSEIKNMEDKIGKTDPYGMKLVYQFKKRFANRLTTKKFSYMLNPKLKAKGVFTYSYRAPFIPLLFWDEVTLRDCVSPKREWIDPTCSICSFAGSKNFESEIPIDQFCDEAGEKLGESHFIRAVKLRAFTNGINVLDPKLARAVKYLDRSLEKKNINLQEILTHYGLEHHKTVLRVKLEGVLT